MSVKEQIKEPSPTLASTSANTFHYGSPLSPSVTPSRYDYEYSQQTAGQPSAQWNGSQTDQQHSGLDVYPSHDGNNSYNSVYGYEMGGAYQVYDEFPTGTGLSTTPPTMSFAATGLPFRGLEFIRNYNSAGYVMGDQDSLWQSYDPGAFEYNPEIPFTLGDADILHDGTR